MLLHQQTGSPPFQQGNGGSSAGWRWKGCAATKSNSTHIAAQHIIYCFPGRLINMRRLGSSDASEFAPGCRFLELRRRVFDGTAVVELGHGAGSWADRNEHANGLSAMVVRCAGDGGTGRVKVFWRRERGWRSRLHVWRWSGRRQGKARQWQKGRQAGYAGVVLRS